MRILWGAIWVLALGCGEAAAPDDATCGGSCDHLGQQTEIVRVPKNALLIPMLRKYASSDHWKKDVGAFKDAARALQQFYGSLGAAVTVQEIWDWNDFIQRTNAIGAQGHPFDRVILIGHGAFDGPMLSDTVLEASFEPGRLRKVTQYQPGDEFINVVTYDPDESAEFSAFVAANSARLLDGQTSLISGLAEHLGVDPACVDDCHMREQQAHEATCRPTCDQRPSCVALTDDLKTDCIAGCMAECTMEYLEDYVIGGCEDMCVTPRSYRVDSSEQRTEPEFDKFAAGLRAVTSPHGLVVLEHCNAATPVDPPGETPTYLSQHAFHHGPHRSFVELVADAAGRYAAGPIGTTSWDDAVKRVEALERDQDQHYLRIIKPK
jgi:hypothetical protein